MEDMTLYSRGEKMSMVAYSTTNDIAPGIEDTLVEELLADHQPGHSLFQIEHFIVNRGNWTPWGRYCQTLREIEKRARGLSQLYDEVELSKLELDELNRAWVFRASKRRRNAIRRRQLQTRLRECTRPITDCKRELQQFINVAVALKKQLGIITPERRLELDEESWSMRLRALVTMELVTQGRVTENTLGLLLTLPREPRDAILSDVQTTMESARLQGRHPLLTWLESIDQGEMLGETYSHERESVPHDGCWAPSEQSSDLSADQLGNQPDSTTLMI